MDRVEGADLMDVMAAADADTASTSRKDDEAWAAYGKAKKRSGRKWGGEKGSRMGKDRVKGDGRTLSGFKRRTEVWNRRDTCDSEYHFAPKGAFRAVP